MKKGKQTGLPTVYLGLCGGGCTLCTALMMSAGCWFFREYVTFQRWVGDGIRPEACIGDV